MNRPSARCDAALLLVILLILPSVAAQAQDAAQGRSLARQWCTSCHLVEPGIAASDTAPPFATIAKDPASTPERLHGWLAAPHPPMPDLHLSGDEENDLVAYLLSLKSQ
jgi:mono/diheme cytochrome c family protein